MLARRGQRWPLRWREPPCGAKRDVSRLGRRLRGRCCARLLQATLASTLARATLWPGPTRLLLGEAATKRWLLITLALPTLWRGSTRLLLRTAAARSLPCSLNAGSAGFYAGASHPVARGGACAA